MIDESEDVKDIVLIHKKSPLLRASMEDEEVPMETPILGATTPPPATSPVSSQSSDDDDFYERRVRKDGALCSREKTASDCR